jgi:hypothetical protein
VAFFATVSCHASPVSGFPETTVTCSAPSARTFPLDLRFSSLRSLIFVSRSFANSCNCGLVYMKFLMCTNEPYGSDLSGIVHIALSCSLVDVLHRRIGSSHFATYSGGWSCIDYVLKSPHAAAVGHCGYEPPDFRFTGGSQATIAVFSWISKQKPFNNAVDWTVSTPEADDISLGTLQRRPWMKPPPTSYTNSQCPLRSTQFRHRLLCRNE